LTEIDEPGEASAGGQGRPGGDGLEVHIAQELIERAQAHRCGVT